MMPRARTPSSLVRAAARSWTASLPGFALHGWVLATSAARALAEGEASGLRGDAVRAALELGALEAAVLGAPAALLFAVAHARVRRHGWLPSLGAVLVVGGALAAALAAWGCAAVDAGLARGPALHVALGAVTAAAGAAAAAAVGRAPLASEAREGRREAARTAR
jgi:hypothetical protein